MFILEMILALFIVTAYKYANCLFGIWPDNDFHKLIGGPLISCMLSNAGWVVHNVVIKTRCGALCRWTLYDVPIRWIWRHFLRWNGGEYHIICYFVRSWCSIRYCISQYICHCVTDPKQASHVTEGADYSQVTARNNVFLPSISLLSWWVRRQNATVTRYRTSFVGVAIGISSARMKRRSFFFWNISVSASRLSWICKYISPFLLWLKSLVFQIQCYNLWANNQRYCSCFVLKEVSDQSRNSIPNVLTTPVRAERKHLRYPLIGSPLFDQVQRLRPWSSQTHWLRDAKKNDLVVLSSSIHTTAVDDAEIMSKTSTKKTPTFAILHRIFKNKFIMKNR